MISCPFRFQSRLVRFVDVKNSNKNKQKSRTNVNELYRQISSFLSRSPFFLASYFTHPGAHARLSLARPTDTKSFEFLSELHRRVLSFLHTRRQNSATPRAPQYNVDFVDCPRADPTLYRGVGGRHEKMRKNCLNFVTQNTTCCWIFLVVFFAKIVKSRMFCRKINDFSISGRKLYFVAPPGHPRLRGCATLCRGRGGSRSFVADCMYIYSILEASCCSLF